MNNNSNMKFYDEVVEKTSKSNPDPEITQWTSLISIDPLNLKPIYPF